MKEIEKNVVISNGTASDIVKNAHGIAIYFPTKGVDVYYRRLGFALKAKYWRLCDAMVDVITGCSAPATK